MAENKWQQAAVYAGLAAAALGVASVVKKGKKEEETYIPLDVKMGLTSMKHKKIRWGFMGAGRVAHDFANALKAVEGATLEAVAVSSGLERCEKFRKMHGFNRALPSYKALLEDSDIDVVYLSAMHSSRTEHVPMILNAGKHAVVEKPIACTAKDADSFFQLAQKKGLFLMEGMWTRFFPAVEHARALMDSGTIGPVTAVVSDFGFDAADSGVYPADVRDPTSGDPIYHASLGGGALLWAGPYPIAAGLLPFNGQSPVTITAAGVPDPRTNVELSASVALRFQTPGGRVLDDEKTAIQSCPARGAVASLFTAIDSESAETTTYVGQKGRLVVESPGHCPTALSLHLKAKGRGALTSKTLNFPLPKLPSTAAKNSNGDYFFYPNSMGFAYEAAAVSRVLAAGLLECPQYTSSDCLHTMTIIDQARASVLSALPSSS